MKRQSGLSLTGLLSASVVVVFLAIVATKVMPAFVEYFTVVRHIKQIAASGETTSVSVVRNAYDRRASIDETPSISGADLEITKAGNDVVISFSYSKKIPLAGNVSLLIDFSGRSSGGGRLAGV